MMRRWTPVIILLLLAAGCAPDITETDFYSRHPDEPIGGSELVTIGSASVAGYSVEVLSESDLHIGPNTLLVEITSGGQPVVSGSVSARALWSSNVRDLEPPFGHDEASVANDDDRFELNVYFLEPVGEEGQWTLEIGVDGTESAGSSRIDVTVDPDMWVQYSDGSGPDDGYYLSWIQPVEPKTGETPLEFAIYRLTDTGFVPVTDATLDLYPYMDMGGGEGHSTPYEAPVHTGQGLYRGSVNFIMAGGWDMTVFVNEHGRDETIVFEGFTVR
jgi:hypothetical protein